MTHSFPTRRSSVFIVASPGAGPSAGNAVLPYVVAVAVALAFLELHRHILRGLHAGDLGEALVILLLPVLAAGAIWTFGIRDVRTAGYVYAATRDRTSVVEGQSVSVRVDFGGRRYIKKK